MADPYRSAEIVPTSIRRPPGVEPLSAGELAFWERIYAACIGHGMKADEKAKAADKAVEQRRARFGVR